MPRRIAMTIDRMRVIQASALLLGALMQFWFIRHLGSTPTGSDSATYLRNASSFASLHALLSRDAFGHATAAGEVGNYWPAGYSGFLYLFHGLGSSKLPIIRIVQAAMMLSLAVMAYFLTRSYSRLVATITLVVVALSPTLIWGAIWIGYEPLLAWLITLPLTLLWCGAAARSGLWVAVVSGLLFSLALIVQFKVVLVLPVLAFLVWRMGRARVVAFSGGLLVPIGLWTARNGIATGSPVPWSTNGPVNIWIGNNPAATGDYMNPPHIPPGWGHSFVGAAIHFATTQPERFLNLQVVKTTHLLAPTVLSTYIWNEPVAWQRLLTVVQWFGALIVAVLFIVFLCEWLWRPEARAVKLAPLAVFVVLFAASCIPFITDARGGMPVETILLAICVPTVFDMLSLGQSKDASSASVNHPDTPLVRATRVELKE